MAKATDVKWTSLGELLTVPGVAIIRVDAKMEDGRAFNRFATVSRELMADEVVFIQVVQSLADGAAEDLTAHKDA